MTRSIARPLALAISASLLAIALPAAAQQRVEVGNAASVVGEVTLSNAQARNPRPVTRRQRIAWGDTIETARRAQLQILLLDRSSFAVGPRSRLVVDRYVYDPAQGRSMFATLLRGTLRFFSGLQDGTNSGEVTTPSGRIGIRGTAIDMLVGEDARSIGRNEPAVGDVRANEDEATLVVLRGPGASTQGGLTPGMAEVTAAGVTVRLDRPGQAAFIPRNGSPPIGPFQISDAGLTRVIDELSASVARTMDGSVLDTLLPVAGAAAVVGAAVLLTDGNGDNGTATAQDDNTTATTAGTNDQTSPTGAPTNPNSVP